MTNQEIKTVGQTIAQETQIGGNTAARVGGVVEGIGVALDNKDAANGYYQATINGGTITVNAPNYLLGSGGNLRIKMPSAGTTASTLTIGNANAVQLWYNGAAVSAQNTWEADEIISVFFDGTRFMASNSQGGGGKAEKIKYDNSTSGLAAGNVQEAIDETVGKVKNINEFEEVVAFEQGGINTSGIDVDATQIKAIRIRSEWIPSDTIHSITITPSNNQKFYWYKYNQSKVQEANSGAWIDTPRTLTLEKNKYYRFCVLKGSNENITVADLAVEFSFLYYNYTKKLLFDSIASSMEGVDICKIVPMRKLGISTNDELKINDVRVSIVDHIMFHDGVKLQLKPNGQMLYWYEYDSSKTLINTSGAWITTEQTLDVVSGHSYRFSFGKTDNASIAIDEVAVNIIITQHADDTKSENMKLFSLFEPACSTRYIFGKGKIWEYPMNTIEAYEAAGKDSRCWAIVGDVQYTSDGYYVMFHDRSLTFEGRTTTINDLTYAQVQTILIDNQYHVPTLDQFITICRKYGKLPIFEIKAKISALNWTTSNHTQDMINIMEKARGYGMLDTLCVIAQPDDLTWLASNYPQIGKMRLCNYDVSETGKYDTYIAPTIDDPQYIYLSYPKNTSYPNAMGADIITQIHNAGRKCVSYGPRPVPSGFVEDCINLNFDAILLYDNPPEI